MTAPAFARGFPRPFFVHPPFPPCISQISSFVNVLVLILIPIRLRLSPSASLLLSKLSRVINRANRKYRSRGAVVSKTLFSRLSLLCLFLPPSFSLRRNSFHSNELAGWMEIFMLENCNSRSRRRNESSVGRSLLQFQWKNRYSNELAIARGHASFCSNAREKHGRSCISTVFQTFLLLSSLIHL